MSGWTPTSLPSDQKVLAPDWLNPFGAGRPDWDPYGPGSGQYPAAYRPDWDPYGPSYSRNILKMEPGDPILEGLAVQGNLRTINQLYIQRDGFLTAEGYVTLGEPYTLWAYTGNWGSFVLYDNNEAVLSQAYVRPGWYRITGLYPEILWSHLHRFTSAGLSSNELNVLVDAGGYPIDYGLTGQVVDAAGRGMAGVNVILKGSDGGIFTTTTNPGGYYGFDAPSGVYTITAEKPGYSFTPSTGRVWTGTISVAQRIMGYPAGTLPAALPQYLPQYSQPQYITGNLGMVRGRVAEQSGAGIPQAALIADGLMTSVFTDDQGYYELALSPGMHRIDAEKFGFGIQPRSVSVSSGQVTVLDLVGKRMAVLGSGP